MSVHEITIEGEFPFNLAIDFNYVAAIATFEASDEGEDTMVLEVSHTAGGKMQDLFYEGTDTNCDAIAELQKAYVNFLREK